MDLCLHRIAAVHIRSLVTRRAHASHLEAQEEKTLYDSNPEGQKVPVAVILCAVGKWLKKIKLSKILLKMTFSISLDASKKR